jgi:AraC family transcriptional regulator
MPLTPSKVRNYNEVPAQYSSPADNEEVLPGDAICRLVLSSAATEWKDILVEEHHLPSIELADITYKRHVVVINIGRSTIWESKEEGQFRRVFKARGAISFFLNHQPFSGRLKVAKGALAKVLLLALNSVFVSRVAEGLDLDSDRIELVEHRGSIDPTLHHIGMALRAGVQTGVALDPMYGEALSTALVVHLLREHGGAVLGPRRQSGGLPRDKLVRAVEYIQDQLDTDLTVSGIAQAVYMSPYHFTRLFKESTGQTPHQYVVDARVKKAKELLTTGKFTISEAAHQVGFVDQSHLSRHFKRVFGLPPKRLLSSRRLQIAV